MSAGKSAVAILVQQLPRQAAVAAAEPGLRQLLEERAPLEQQLQSLVAQMAAAPGEPGDPASQLQPPATALASVAAQATVLSRRLERQCAVRCRCSSAATTTTAATWRHGVSWSWRAARAACVAAAGWRATAAASARLRTTRAGTRRCASGCRPGGSSSSQRTRSSSRRSSSGPSDVSWRVCCCMVQAKRLAAHAGWCGMRGWRL